MAPVQERPAITVQEAVARRMLKIRAKLGITAADLMPASVALESEAFKLGLSGSGRTGQDGDSDSATAECTRGIEVDVQRWKKEAEDMLGLLGSNADHGHEYPMAELKKREVEVMITMISLTDRSISDSNEKGRDRILVKSAVKHVLAGDGSIECIVLFGMYLLLISSIEK